MFSTYIAVIITFRNCLVIVVMSRRKLPRNDDKGLYCVEKKLYFFRMFIVYIHVRAYDVCVIRRMAHSC